MSTVRDNPALHRFELDVDGVIAFSEYRRKPGVVTFIHTEVPESLGGKGVGSKLARGALDLVRASGEKVIAKCPFIAAFIKKNAEYQDLLAEPL
ncbi:MAG: N-acetyltransferase [Alphaproteobacteria bacterium]|nr:N-acetyltransferase [Alphaproteobacteria bacterium]